MIRANSPEMNPSFLRIPPDSYSDPNDYFSLFKMICSATHSDWSDRLVFLADSSVAGYYNSLIEKYLRKNPAPSPHASAMRYVKRAGNPVGKFQRSEKGDTGLFYLSSAEGGRLRFLVLAWDVWDPEILVCDCDFLPYVFKGDRDFSIRMVATLARPAPLSYDGMRFQPGSALTRDEMLLRVKSMFLGIAGVRAALSSLCLSSGLKLRLGYVNHSSSGYLTTTAPNQTRPALEVCAIDCEMCETALGKELTRVSVVCPERGVMLDTFVKPERPIVNYLTEFSGIREATLVGVSTTLKDVHAHLRVLLNANTIIVGHSLENDLEVLKLDHARVIDTVALYPHKGGLPFKQKLIRLVEDVLHRSMREREGGEHCSIEDACLALELTLLKAAKASKKELVEERDMHNVFDNLSI